ncbi:hypothetical protein KCH_07840 [Kitasatospora cheerisanensis KCTC 2395]|uniref:Uncharacterized protein n=1 Tax=Kitasatospora cheerisanensis KCTC 2395 TaxID=1348663 RepID=A0A066Z1M1_9ACTN|nr:hypothetical protein KCH_07840 [Kitasatospora cheerisanensis KCTC 2395]
MIPRFPPQPSVLVAVVAAVGVEPGGAARRPSPPPGANSSRNWTSTASRSVRSWPTPLEQAPAER